MPARSLDQIVNLCKRRGFVFPGSAAYGGLGSFWDYGPLGVEMLNNVKKAWWADSVYAREDMEGVDAALLMSRKVWQHSGHEATFSDPLVDCKKCQSRYRLDHLVDMRDVVVRYDQFDAMVDQLPAGLRAEAYKISRDTERGAKDFTPKQLEILDEGLPDKDDPKFMEVASSLLDNDEIAHMSQSWMEYLRLVGQNTTEFIVARLRAGLVSCPDCGGNQWTEPRDFNLMFQTHVGPVAAKPGTDEEKAARVYLRPETAQGIFMNFAHVQRSLARKVPFGIAQIGKAFRNEITPGNFIFRTREFEQMEIEFFIKPPQFVQEGEKTDEQWHQEWIERRFNWWLKYARPATQGIDGQDRLQRSHATVGEPNHEKPPVASAPPPMQESDEQSSSHAGMDEGVHATGEEERAARFRQRPQTPDELAHYAKATTDIEYLFPGSLGWGEIEGVANRTDFDLSAHSKDVPEEDLKRLQLEPNKDSNEKFDYFDPDAKQRYIPWVIEPSAGVTRAVLTFLCEAYHEEIVTEPTKQEIDQIKSDVAMIIKNAEKKIKQAEKDAEKDKQPKHDPAAVQAFIDKLAEARDGLPASLMAVEDAFNHEGAQNLEPVKKFRPWLEKLVENLGRRVLRLHPALAPIKLAVFPLKKNKPELVELAKSIKAKFARDFRVVYDDSAGIGRLYRRQDEIGTPYCITVDFDSLEDGTVTVRERDSMEQERVHIDDLESYLLPRLR